MEIVDTAYIALTPTPTGKSDPAIAVAATRALARGLLDMGSVASAGDTEIAKASIKRWQIFSANREAGASGLG